MPPAVTETDESRPLNEDERKTLSSLLSRDSQFKAPAVRQGEPYRALVNLSVPRRGDKDLQCDLVYAGDTVYLTAEEAAAFNRHGQRDGRQVEVLQKLSGPDGSREQRGPVPPRAVSGRIFTPPVPPRGSDAPRPDPEGSSQVQYFDDAPVPERDQPQPDPAHAAATMTAAPEPDAVDVPPRRNRTRGGQ